MKKKKSISIFIPAFNEAENLEATLNTIERMRSESGIEMNADDIEYLIINDGSGDATGKIAESLAQRYPNVKVTHNSCNRGLGYNLEVAIQQAGKQFFTFMPGDNETTEKTIRILFQSVQLRDCNIYIPYQGNPGVRPIARQILSRMFTKGCNALFGMKLRYFNGPCAIDLALLRKVKLLTDGPSQMAGILITLIKGYGATYMEIPMHINPQPGRKSRLLKWKNVWRIAKHMYRLKQHLRTAPLI